MTDDELKALADLLPCPNPWCEALERDGDYSPQVSRNSIHTRHVACTSCCLEGPKRATEREAIAAWNARDNLPAIIEQRAEIERLRDIIASLCQRVEVQADCLIRYAEQNGEKAKPLPSVYHIQASHFCDFAREARAALNPTGEA